LDDARVTDSSIESLYREEGDRLWWALLAYTSDREIASDAASEAFARALATSETIRDPSSWVWRVAFRVATMEMRSRPKHQVSEEPGDEIDGTAVGVMIALRQLPERQRAVACLFYLEDRSTKEIASLLGMAVPTVSVHLHRARNRLRTILEEHDA
jgi:RNA polymerase sigma-70 factor (ECF subfamily)